VQLSECIFHHRLDVPALKDQTGWQWDLIGDEGAYLGNFDFSGKRVLEFGPASGALTFWMEKQGADVVAMDVSPDSTATSWDVMLREGDDIAAMRQRMSQIMERLNNGFWYAHEHFRSRARLVHGTAYDVPRAIGKFDVVTMCAILLHLRDPIRALEHALEFTRDSIIIADLVPFHLNEQERERPLASFIPSPKRITPHGGITWWHVSPVVYKMYLDMRGLDTVSLTYSKFRHTTRPYDMFQLIARWRRSSRA
jgi:SAM-dependent methyltransferase